jgi:CRP-like cAMP-binding protein
VDEEKDEYEKGFSVILEGFVDVKSSGEQICLLGRGDFFGEENFDESISGIGLLGNLLAMTPARLLTIPRSYFYRIPMFELHKLRNNT